MLGYVLKRTLATIPVMAFVALFVFSLLYIAPGDPAAVIAGDQASPEDVEKIRKSLGLDRPFVARFAEWSWQVLRGDLGKSIFTGLPVTELIGQRIEPTVSLMVVTLILSIIVAIPIGVVAAWRSGGWLDRSVMGLAVLGFSIPVFVVGYLLAYVFALELDWLPVQGYTPISKGLWPWLENLILPAIALVLLEIADILAAFLLVVAQFLGVGFGFVLVARLHVLFDLLAVGADLFRVAPHFAAVAADFLVVGPALTLLRRGASGQCERQDAQCCPNCQSLHVVAPSATAAPAARCPLVIGHTRSAELDRSWQLDRQPGQRV